MELQQENSYQSQDNQKSKSKNVQCDYCSKKFTEQKNLARHVSVVHDNIRRFSCESYKKEFASKQEVVRHLEKGCFMRKLEQFPDSQGAAAHSTTKPFLPKSAEHPNLEPAVTSSPNDDTSQGQTKSSMLDFEHFEHKRKQMQTPTPNIQENETKQIISDYTCKYCNKRFDTSRGLLTHKNTCNTICEKCDLPILTQNSDFHQKRCDGSKDYDFDTTTMNLIEEHCSRYPCQFPDKNGCGKCGEKFTQKRNLEIHILTVHYINFKMYPCLKCSKLFTSKQILERHVKTVHKEEMFQDCPNCKMLFSPQALGKHLKNCVKSNECEKCGVNFSSKKNCEYSSVKMSRLLQ